MARTKQHFGVVVTTITQWWSPTVIRVTADRTVRDQIRRTSDGGLACHFPERLVLIANHQVWLDAFHVLAPGSNVDLVVLGLALFVVDSLHGTDARLCLYHSQGIAEIPPPCWHRHAVLRLRLHG